MSICVDIYDLLKLQCPFCSILKLLGSGEFGQVCKAVWSISGATKELAVKTLRAELPEEEKVRFLQEAAIMGQFSHPNVVKLYGVVTVGEPVSYRIHVFIIDNETGIPPHTTMKTHIPGFILHAGNDMY